MAVDDELRFRTIIVSTRAALARGDETRVKGRANELLAALAVRVLNNGADPEILRAIDAARRKLSNDEPSLDL